MHDSREGGVGFWGSLASLLLGFPWKGKMKMCPNLSQSMLGHG